MPTGVGEFIDTNVLVYEWDSADPKKRDAAQKLVKRLSGRGVISSQVAQEFAWTVQRKLGLARHETARILQSYRVFRFVPVQLEWVAAALGSAEQNVIGFWDALIVKAAANAGCKVLHTEDLNHGQEIRGVRISNPFRS